MHISFNPLNAELNAICYLLALLGAHPILHVSRIKVKVIKFILLYAARHVSDTTVSINRSFLLLHMQSLVTVWCWVGCFLQPCSVVLLYSNNRTRLEKTTDPTPHGDQKLHVQQ
jgi:hypothetical protein